MNATLERLETTANQKAPVTFVGMHIYESDSMHHIDLDFYKRKIEQILSDAESRKFACMRMRLAWLANNRPNIELEISQIAQVARAMFEKDIIKHFNCLTKAIKYVDDHKPFNCIPNLDYTSLRITTYSDASFASNSDLFSQLGRIVLVTDDYHISIPVSSKSYKSIFIASSALSAEEIAFPGLFDDAPSI